MCNIKIIRNFDVLEFDYDGQGLKKKVNKEVDYSTKKVKSEFSPHKKDNKDVITEVTDESEIAMAAFIQQEIELELWSWDDLDSEVDSAEGVPGVGGESSNSLKTVDRISKGDR
ncbi:hypothetical protein Tco_0094543, partial [Tanacetum coccineum]